MVEAAGIEPYPALFEKQRLRATFVIKSKKGNELICYSLPFPVPWSPPRSWRDSGKRRDRCPDAQVGGSGALLLNPAYPPKAD